MRTANEDHESHLQRLVLGGGRRLLQPLLLRAAPDEAAAGAAPLLGLFRDCLGGVGRAVAGAGVCGLKALFVLKRKLSRCCRVSEHGETEGWFVRDAEATKNRFK